MGNETNKAAIYGCFPWNSIATTINVNCGPIWLLRFPCDVILMSLLHNRLMFWIQSSNELPLNDKRLM